MKKYLFLLFFFFSILILPQESTVKLNYQGKDFTQLKHAWTAQWITHPTESTLDYGVFLFRRSFMLDKKPLKFKIYISADNRYMLFVNGKRISSGPALGDIQHYRYENYNISKFLKKGKNVIAVQVVNFGEFRKAAIQTFQTALILQGDKSNEANVNTGTGFWKVIKNQAYSYIPFTSDSLKTYYAAGPGDKVIGKLYPWGWQKTKFDDSKWLKPRKATVEFAVGRGFLYGSTWFLVPRKIPFLEETVLRFKKVARVKGIKINKGFVKGKNPSIVPSNSKVSILLDQTFHTTGFPQLSYSKGEGSRIKITYAEALMKTIKTDEPISDGNLLNVDLKGNRNKIKYKHIFGYYDLIFPDGGVNRMFRPLSRRTYRFVQLDITTANEPLVINDFYGIYTVYPFREKAKFVTDNPLLKNIWNTAWRTLRNSSQEIFADPYYEQLQYIGDSRIEALVSIYVSGDDKLMRKAIEQFDDSRITNGLTQSRYPSYITQVIPTYSLIWIHMLHDYYIYRNDPEFLKKFLPGMRSVLEWFSRRVDSTGMAANLDWWNFTDWTAGFPNGIPPGADNGYSANVNLQLAYALNDAVELFNNFGWDYEAAKYEKLSSGIRKSVYLHCFNKSDGLFAETPAKKIYSQHTNIFAILSNAFPAEQQKKLMKKIIKDKQLIQSTIYFKFYLFRALQKVGLGNLYLTMLQPWKNMIDKGMTTFGETDINPRSECHAWSSSPCFDFLHMVAGIYPLEPGFKSVMIEPNFGDLKSIDVIFPHYRGLIKIDLKRENMAVEGKIVLPEKLTGKFKWGNKEIHLKSGENKIILR